MVMGNQTWNSQEREFLFGYQGDLFIESVNDSLSVSFFAALGYHQRGSAIVVNSYYNPQTGQTFPRRKINQPFNNIVLQLGAKNGHRLNNGLQGYYGIGIRGEYTVSYNLAYQSDGFDFYLNRFNYGISVTGGMEYEFPGFPAGLFFEISVHPDVSRQIFLPGNTVTYYDYYTNEPRTYPEQKVTNLSLEVTVGYKFIRRVEWID